MPKTPTWQDQHLLFHYTTSVEVVASILRHGFMVFPNRRNLINRLLMMPGFEQREPQQFGMVSFTELQREDVAYHRERFGNFGIAVSWSWAMRHHVQRVIYLGEGHIMNTFAWLFQYGKQELERNYRGEGGLEALLVNRAMAGLYSQLYSRLLTLYEYMETERNSRQVEWRIVNPLPQYYDLHDMDALKEKLLAYAMKGIGTIGVRPADIEMLVCPRSQVATLRQAIPDEFKDVPIVPYAFGSRMASGFRSFWRFVEANMRRRLRPVVQVVPPPPSGGPVIGKSSQIPGFFDLPPVGKINGIAVYADDLLDAAYCNLQYDSTHGHSLQLDMPFEQTIVLQTYLARMAQDPRHQRLVEMVALRQRSPDP